MGRMEGGPLSFHWVGGADFSGDDITLDLNVEVWTKSIAGRGNCKREDPEAGICLRNRKAATGAEAEWVRER